MRNSMPSGAVAETGAGAAENCIRIPGNLYPHPGHLPALEGFKCDWLPRWARLGSKALLVRPIVSFVGDLTSKAIPLYISDKRFDSTDMTSTISSKGQVTLPAALRLRLGWKAGTKLVFDEQGDCLVARPAFEISEMKSVLGCAREFEPGKSSQKVLSENRGYDRRSL